MKTEIVFGRRLLETLTIALYENPIIFFREYVQNSLDAYNQAKKEGCKEIKDFHVAIIIDRQKKKIKITDNGYGIPDFVQFKRKMLSNIGNSEKIFDQIGNIGFRGIGRISGLPFCNDLVFRNKAKGAHKIQECIWHGSKYKELLNDEAFKGDLSDFINQIVEVKEYDLNVETPEQHFFEVTLKGYSNEISEIVGEPGKNTEERFKKRLSKMLPLRYKDSFKGGRKIVAKYCAFMKESLDQFMIPVKYEGVDLYKVYEDKHVLKSDIVFWEVRGKKKQDGAEGDKIGLLWFTFEPHLRASSTDEDYGILTRSKNVLMGTSETFAQVAEESGVYITTYREMVQALRAINGELLINSPRLKDNARRDWFLSDSHSNELRNVIADFMLRLHKYRYCASRYYRENATKKKEDLMVALEGLVDIKENKINYDLFYKKDMPEKVTDKKKVLPSEEDIPSGSLTLKKYYDVIMRVIESYFEKTKDRETFLKLRAYVAKHLREMHNGTNSSR